MAALPSDTVVSRVADTTMVAPDTQKLSELQQQQVTAITNLTESFGSLQIDEQQRRRKERKNTKSILLRLPAELRNWIFELAFVHALYADGSCKRSTWADAPNLCANADVFAYCKVLILGPSSMNACRQMRSECRSLLGLDNVVVTKFQDRREPIKPSSPMQLIEDVRSVTHFKAFCHDSEEEAREVAQHWKNSIGTSFSGTIACDPALGLQCRSFIAWDMINMPKIEQFQISKHRRATYCGKFGRWNWPTETGKAGVCGRLASRKGWKE